MKELILEARTESILQLTAFIDSELEALGCPLKAQTQIDIAVDELFSNIARYAYASGKGSATVRLDPDPDGHGVSVTFTDSGVPFDPLSLPEPDVTLSAKERKIGGLGIFVVKKTMDSVRYRFEHGKNILTIRKRW